MRLYLLPSAISLIALFATTGFAQNTADADAGQSGITEQSKRGACNFDEFARAVVEVQKRRQQRLVDAKQFAKMAQEPGVMILDARSELSYELLHVKNSVNLPYTNFGRETLDKLIPSEYTKVLIYCRNNIENKAYQRVENQSYASYIVPKQRAAGLNIPVAVTLYIYGYENVWELDEIVDPDDSPIAFEWTAKYREIERQMKSAAAKKSSAE